MFSRSLRWIFISLAYLTAAGSLDETRAADEYEVKMIDNSKTFSQAIAINAKCEILGAREVMDGPGIGMKTYFRSSDTDVHYYVILS